MAYHHTTYEREPWRQVAYVNGADLCPGDTRANGTMPMAKVTKEGSWKDSQMYKGSGGKELDTVGDYAKDGTSGRAGQRQPPAYNGIRGEVEYIRGMWAILGGQL